MIRLIVILGLACFAGFASAQGGAEQGTPKGAPATSQEGLLSKRAFTQRMIQELSARISDATFSVVDELIIKRTDTDGTEGEFPLASLYREYSAAPGRLAALMSELVTALSEKCLADCGGKVDTTRITPLIKGRGWLQESRARLKQKGADVDFVYDDLNGELIIVYVRDAESRVRFLLTNEDLGVERAGLRALAVANLGRMRPEIKTLSHGNMLTMFDVGGTYEASLLLFDSIWTDGQLKVDGDIVVAVPTGDALLVTGSKNRKGLAILRQAAAKFAAERGNPITDKLFVYRDGRFKRFGRK